MNKFAKIAIGCGVGAAAAAAAVYTGAAFALVSRRKSMVYDSMMKKQSANRLSPALVALNKKRDALRAVDMEEVTIQSHDGLTLVGHFYPAENAKRVVICVHGYRSFWYYDFAGGAQTLHENGCSILFVEQRTHGASQGKYICYGMLERFDMQLWVDYVNHRNVEELPIYLYGISMGAASVLMASALPLKDVISGIIADCGFTSPKAIIKSTMKKQTGIFTDPIIMVCSAVSGLLARCRYDDYSTLDAMKENTVPTLFIHGGDDDFVPMDMTLQNYSACAAAKELLIIPGAGHAMSHVVATREYEDKVFKFFENHD